MQRPFRASLMAATVCLAQPVIAAELQGYVYKCPDREGMCYWHKASVSPPKGWREDEAWTQRYKALVMFPSGDKSRSKPMMYVRAHHGDRELKIEDYIGTAQQRWKQRVPDSTIAAQPDVERAGKPTLKVFLYKNPSIPEQAFELTAFMKDISNAPNTSQADMYFFQAVLVAPNAKELEKAKPAFYELLGRL